MRLRYFIVLSLIIGGVACQTGFSNVAVAQQADADTKAEWVSKCIDDDRGGVDSCRLVRRVFSANSGTRQKLLTFLIHRPKREKPFIRLQLPTNLDRRSGVSIAVMEDDSNVSALAYRFSLQNCKETACFAKLELTSELLTAMKTHKRLLIGFATAEQEKVKAWVSLTDFARAYDDLDGLLH